MEVFPIVPRGKAPLTPNGFYDATTDQTQINLWWTRWPNANIGYRIPTGILVVDVDPRNGGSVPEALPSTRTALTGGGGYHFYYHYNLQESRAKRFKRTAAPGVDLKTDGYTLLAPSYTDSEYRWQDFSSSITELQPETYNDWLKDETVYSTVAQWEDDPTDTRPGTLYNREAIARGEEFWKELLEPEGWTIVGRDSSSGFTETYWCRPGKSEGISATTNYQGSGLLYVFSSSTLFESEKAYTPFSAYVIQVHNGNYTEGARVLSDTGFCGSLGTVDTSDRTENIVEPYNYTSPFPENHFVNRFVEYVHRQTDAPHEYAEAAALSLLSIAAYKCHAALAPFPGGLPTNLYIVLVGPTTRSRKSTVQRIAGSIAKSVMPPALLPNRATTEGLISALASRSGVPSFWTPDEFGVTLAEVYQRDFMKGLEEMLLTVYAGDDYEYKRSMDTLTIRQPSLSILGAATPESISRAGTTALDSGLLPRFAIVYPSVMPEPTTVGVVPAGLDAERAAIVSKLNAILVWANTHTEITFEPEALDILNHGEQELTKGSATARLPTMLYKVATLSAVSEQRAVVNAVDARAAVAVVTRWAEGMKNLVPQMYRHGSDQQFEQQLEYATSLLADSNGQLRRVDVANHLNVRKSRMDEIENTLLDKGKIKTNVLEGVKWWQLR